MKVSWKFYAQLNLLGNKVILGCGSESVKFNDKCKEIIGISDTNGRIIIVTIKGA